jgi:hypothetical protein
VSLKKFVLIKLFIYSKPSKLYFISIFLSSGSSFGSVKVWKNLNLFLNHLNFESDLNPFEPRAPGTVAGGPRDSDPHLPYSGASHARSCSPAHGRRDRAAAGLHRPAVAAYLSPTPPSTLSCHVAPSTEPSPTSTMLPHQRHAPPPFLFSSSASREHPPFLLSTPVAGASIIARFHPSTTVFFPSSVSITTPCFPWQWMRASLSPFPPLAAGPCRCRPRPPEPPSGPEHQSSSTAELPHRGLVSPMSFFSHHLVRQVFCAAPVPAPPSPPHLVRRQARADRTTAKALSAVTARASAPGVPRQLGQPRCLGR